MSAPAPVPPAITVSPVDGSGQVLLDTPVTVSSDRGKLDSIVIHSSVDPTPLQGALARDGRTWKLEASLDPDTTYVVEASAHIGSGDTARARARFTTMPTPRRLTTNPSPDDGATVGVGMPIILRFNSAVAPEHQAALVQRIKVTSTPAVEGAWHWFGPSEVHFRPKDYWPAGTKVSLDARLKGVDAGGGVWGLADWSESFTVGDKHTSVIDTVSHQMQVFNNDQLIHTYPVSTGREPQFPTISGTLFVWYKVQKVHMDSLSIGIPHNAPGGYDEDVFWDTAISTNGFYVHAAPWSEYAQGNTNVSHGCVNLSTARATEFFHFSQVGDVVTVTGTSRAADAGDGEGDWQIPFAQYANSGGASSAPVTTAPAGD